MPKRKKKADNWDQIRGHLFFASHELLLAAKGVIKMCQNEGLINNSPQIDTALTKASKLAEEFADGITKSSSFSDLAKDILIPIIKATPKPTKKTQQQRTKRRK